MKNHQRLISHTQTPQERKVITISLPCVYRRLNPGALIGFYRVDHYGTRQMRLMPLKA